MNKRIVVIGLFLILSGQLFSQAEKTRVLKKFTAVASLYNDIWLNLPEGIDTRTINQGFSGYMMYNHHLGKGNVYVAIGAGIGSHNVFSNGIINKNSDGIIEMINFDTAYTSMSYKKNKLSVTYFDFPMELLIVTKKDFRFVVGLKPGFNIDSHTKYIGDDYITSSTEQLRQKNKKIDHIENWRYAVTARIGWKSVSLYGAYSMTGLFSKDKGPDLVPVSIGISITSF